MATQKEFRVKNGLITGAGTVNELRYPLTDGAANQVLTTDGAGNLSFTDTTANWTVTDLVVDSLQFTGGTGQQGLMNWNVDEETVNLVMDGTTLHLGQDTLVHVRNNTAGVLAKGTAVMVVGTLGASGRLLVEPMIADGTIQPRYFLGLTSEDIAANTDGMVITFGKIRQIDTSIWPQGSVLWLDPVANGGLTTTQPQAPNLKIATAIVISSGVSGTLMVRANPGIDLHNNHRVEIVNPDANGNPAVEDSTLMWNNTLTRWENHTPAETLTSLGLDTVVKTGDNISVLVNDAGYLTSVALNDLTDVDTTGAIVGSVLKYDGANWIIGSDNTGAGGTITLTDLSVTQNPAAGNGTLTYNNTNGVFTYTPPDLTAYLTTETDPVFTASAAATITAGNITNWNTAFGWGDHSVQGYLTSESDPIFTASAAAGITAGNITNWDTAFGWGDHSVAGYLTSVAINDLTDVTITTPILNDLIIYDGAGWVNIALANHPTQQELDQTQTGAGLAANGNYQPLTGTNYLDASTSLAQSIEFLDIAIGNLVIPSLLNDLTDVDTTGAVNGSIIKYNGTSWVIGTDETGGAGSVALADLTDTTITAPADGNGVIYNGTTWENVPLVPPSTATSGRRYQVWAGTITSITGNQLIDPTLAPTVASGLEIWTQTVDLSSATSTVRIDSSLAFQVANASASFVVVIFRDGVPIGGMVDTAANKDSLQTVTFNTLDLPGTAGTHVYSARVGSSNGAVWSVNPAATLGGLLAGNGYSVEEII